VKPFRSFVSQNTESPLVVSNPHSGLEIHPLRPALKLLPKEVFLRDADYEVHRFWEGVCKDLDISWIGARYHRYNLDLNRPSLLNADFVEGHSIIGKGETKGLFWTESTNGENLGFKKLNQQTADELIKEIWTPYYSWIEEELSKRKKKFGFALLIDGHSMPSRGDKNHSDQGAERADIVPGNLDFKTCPSSVSQALEKLCQEFKLSCRFNNPYKGGNITQSFYRPEESIYTLQIEVNRKIYMNENTKVLNEAGIQNLERLFKAFLQKLATL
jgi:N-formylglutamate amidohydrolase